MTVPASAKKLGVSISRILVREMYITAIYGLVLLLGVTVATFGALGLGFFFYAMGDPYFWIIFDPWKIAVAALPFPLSLSLAPARNVERMSTPELRAYTMELWGYFRLGL